MSANIYEHGTLRQLGYRHALEEHRSTDSELPAAPPTRELLEQVINFPHLRVTIVRCYNPSLNLARQALKQHTFTASGPGQMDTRQRKKSILDPNANRRSDGSSENGCASLSLSARMILREVSTRTADCL